MADLYVDHGLYNAASFTGNTTINNGTLTVTAVASGKIVPGMIIAGADAAGVSALSASIPVVITSYGTGTGGTGTYNITPSAASTQTGASFSGSAGGMCPTPAWGSAQEGDGTSAGAATPALGSVVFSGGHSSGSVGIFGASVTPATSSSADDAANKLATAINAATTTVTSTWSLSAPQLRNFVYARGPSGGAPSGTCEIMTRAGSASLNDTGSNTTITQAGFSGTPPTLNQFASGAGGAYGHLYNTHVTLASSLAAGAYGLWTTGSAESLLVGGLSAGDVINVRCNDCKTVVTASITLSPAGPSSGFVKYLFDDGTVWAGDSATATFEFGSYYTGGSSVTVSCLYAAEIVGKSIGTYDWNFTIKHHTTAQTTSLQITGPAFVDGVSIRSPLGGPVTLSCSPAVAGKRGTARNVAIRSPQLTTSFIAFGSNSTYVARIDGLYIDNMTPASIHTNVFVASANTIELVITSLVLAGFLVGSKLFGAVGSGNRVTIVDADLGNVTDRPPVMGAASPTFEYGGYVALINNLGDRDFFFDTNFGLVQWDSGISQPTLNATLDDGVTPWSMLLYTPIGGTLTPAAPLRTSPIVTINSLPTGQRDLTLHLCVDTTLSGVNGATCFATFEYTTGSGERVVLSTLDHTAGALTSDSGSTWSSESGGQVTFVTTGTIYMDKYKVTATTPTGKDLPFEAEVTARLHFAVAFANITQRAFVDPEVEIA